MLVNPEFELAWDAGLVDCSQPAFQFLAGRQNRWWVLEASGWFLLSFDFEPEWIPDGVLGPRHSGSAEFTSMFIARENKVTKMVQPVIIPTSSLWHTDVAGDWLWMQLAFWFSTSGTFSALQLCAGLSAFFSRWPSTTVRNCGSSLLYGSWCKEFLSSLLHWTSPGQI